MNLAADLAALWVRDLTRLAQEIAAFPDDASLWRTMPGVSNSAGNLILHLEGNLREYIGRQLGGQSYTRSRQQEFSQTGFTRSELGARFDTLARTIPDIVSGLADADLGRPFPEVVFSGPLSTARFLIHLHGHFHYHLGQIDYLRRISTESGTVNFAQL
jgi:uncharacterized damage-inducible protein DinB